MPDLELLRSLAPPVEPADTVTVARIRRRTLRPRRRRPVLLAAPVAVCAVLFALVQVGGERTFAEAALRAAEASPRLLVDGWEVTRVDEWDATTGEMTFERDGHRLDLSWSNEAPAKKAGTSIWREGDVWVRAVGFLPAIEQIKQVSAQEWLRALPESAVAPRDQAATVEEMLRGLPLPPGFDRESLHSLQTRDRYQLGARVSGAVACGWIERWLDGDPKAAAALATSRDWPILRQMNAEGDYPEAVWQFADAVAAGGGTGKARVTRETARDGLGC